MKREGPIGNKKYIYIHGESGRGLRNKCQRAREDGNEEGSEHGQARGHGGGQEKRQGWEGREVGKAGRRAAN